jgi:hypothetical protein
VSGKTWKALERAMRAFHDSTQWASERADWSEGRPDDEHPSFETAIDRAIDEDEADAIAEGRRLERADIVADLRARAADSKMDGLSEGLWWAADRIERGEHTKEAT